MTNIVVDWKKLLLVKIHHVRKHFPHWKFVWESDDSAFFEGWVHTSCGGKYCLRLYLNPKWQESLPQLYVWEPVVLPRVPEGTINEAYGHSYHTVSNGPDGRVQICHSSQSDWDSTVSYVLPILRGYLWCEAYGGHLQTGKQIADYFPS
jgi:hypothetical protein